MVLQGSIPAQMYIQQKSSADAGPSYFPLIMLFIGQFICTYSGKPVTRPPNRLLSWPQAGIHPLQICASGSYGEPPNTDQPANSRRKEGR